VFQFRQKVGIVFRFCILAPQNAALLPFGNMF